MNISVCDSIVEEYLIHRGFTKTFHCIQKEKKEDRTKGFDATRIVEQIFTYIYKYDIESFINLWDFLNKRFFLHLDQEHIFLLSNVKSDLIKFYLVNAIKKNNKEKITEFFGKYSHEIISESGESVTGLRSWYVLPYMEEPEKDPEFSVYFTSKWSDMLRVTLNNFLSTILLNAPLPKLMLLEKWFRSEAQQEIRVQLKQASDNVDHLLTRLKSYEDRLITLRGAVKDLVLYLQQQQEISYQISTSQRNNINNNHNQEEDKVNNNRNRNNSNNSNNSNNYYNGTDNQEALERNREETRQLGQTICQLAIECVQQKVEGSYNFNSPGRGKGNNSNQITPEELEVQLIIHIQQWLRSLGR